MRTTNLVYQFGFPVAALSFAAWTSFASAGPTELAISLAHHPLEASEEEGGSSPDQPEAKREIKVQVVNSEHDQKGKQVAWLGVASEEVPEVLDSQLGLQNGDGLVVVFVEPDSPAAKAGIQKNDVLVYLGDQLLVHPEQFRKLVRRQKDGDTIKLTLYRQGKKEIVSTTLAMTTLRADITDAKGPFYQFDVSEPTSADLRRQVRMLHDSVGKTIPGLTRINMEVQRGVEEAREALQDALSHNRNSSAWASSGDASDLEALAHGNVDIDKNTKVIVRKNGKSVKTMVESDDTGTYVLVASPKKHLTVHDKQGKLLFDGEIETSEQQKKVPANLWPKAEKMIEQMGPASDDHPESNNEADPQDG